MQMARRLPALSCPSAGFFQALSGTGSLLGGDRCFTASRLSESMVAVCRAADLQAAAEPREGRRAERPGQIRAALQSGAAGPV